MSEAFTCKNFPISKAPKRIELLGDKTKRPEPAQHIIEFPGGAIEVSRTTDGNYWVHIIVNQDQPFEDGSVRQSARGVIVGSRIGRDGEMSIEEIERADKLEQIAVLIKPVKATAKAAAPVAKRKAA